MQLNLSPDLVEFLQSTAKAKDVSPESVVLDIIRAEMAVVEKREAEMRRVTRVNLALIEDRKSLSSKEFGKEVRSMFDLDKKDQSEEPILVTIPNDKTMTMPFFEGMFDQSIMVLGPQKFFEHYIFDANVENLRAASRYVRVLWDKLKDIELYRVTVGIVGEAETKYTLWMKVRDDRFLDICDDIPVDDFYSYADILAHVKSRGGRIVEDIIAQ